MNSNFVLSNEIKSKLCSYEINFVEKFHINEYISNTLTTFLECYNSFIADYDENFKNENKDQITSCLFLNFEGLDIEQLHFNRNLIIKFNNLVLKFSLLKYEKVFMGDKYVIGFLLNRPKHSDIYNNIVKTNNFKYITIIQDYVYHIKPNVYKLNDSFNYFIIQEYHEPNPNINLTTELLDEVHKLITVYKFPFFCKNNGILSGDKFVVYDCENIQCRTKMEIRQSLIIFNDVLKSATHNGDLIEYWNNYINCYKCDD